MIVNKLGAGVVLISPRRDKMSYVLQFQFTDSNNVAEYEALLHGLCLAASMGIWCLMPRELRPRRPTGDEDV